MTNNTSNIIIGKKNIVWTLSIIIGIITCLLFFNSIDNKRKKEKFFELIVSVKNSEHIPNLISLEKKFNKNDSITFKLIREELTLMRSDNNFLYSCELIIHSNDNFYRIEGYKRSKLKVKNKLWEKENKIIEHLNNGSLEKIYDLTKNDQPIWSVNELPRGRAIEVSSGKNFIFSLMKTSGFQTFLFDHRGRASGNSFD